MNPFVSLAILICLGAGLFAWLSFDETPSLINQPEAEKATLPFAHEPAVSSSNPASEIVPSSTRFQSLTDPAILWQVRTKHLRELDADTLSGPDVDALYALLDHRPSPEHADDWWAVVNEIMEQMRLQSIGRERYANALLAIIRDPSVLEIPRDYSIQHLMQWIAPQGGETGLPQEEDPALIREAITATVTAIIDPDLAPTTIPGTALNMLVNSRAGAIEPKIIDEAFARLEPWFRSVIPGRISINPINRHDAIVAAASLGFREHYPIIRNFAFDEQTARTLRLRSIAAIAIFDEESDLDPMREIARSRNPLSYAAQRAVDKMTTKPTNPFMYPREGNPPFSLP